MPIYIKTHKRKAGVKKNMGVKQAHLLINGNVQGVGYRYFARSVASKYGLTGYVKNTDDGAVEAVLEGEEDKVLNAIEELRRGPSSSFVSKIDIHWKNSVEYYNSFSIVF